MSENCIEMKVMCTEGNDSKKTFARRWYIKNLLLLLTVFGVLLGVSFGFGLRRLHLSDTAILLISYPGELYMRILKLIILPLIISSLIAGSASLNAKMNGKIALRTLILFFTLSSINAVIGVVLAVIIHPGNPGLKPISQMNLASKNGNSVLDSLLDLGRNMIADNIFQATFQQAHTEYINKTVNVFKPNNSLRHFTSTIVKEVRYRLGINTLGIVFFCLIFGTMLGTIGPKGKPIVNFFSVIFDVIMKMVAIVVWLTPLGVTSIIAGKIVSVHDIGVIMSQLFWFILANIIGVFLYQLTVLQLIYFIFIRRNPFTYYFGLMEGLVTSFATASKAAALPLTFSIMDDKLKVDPRITRFVLPIGCNIHMNGTAMFLSISAIFIAQMNRVQLTSGQLVTVCFTSIAGSFSSASVPSAALVLVLMILAAIDIPADDVSLLFTIDWLVDRIRTTNNMLGDCYAAAVVEKLSKKELIACDSVMATEVFEANENLNNQQKDTTLPPEVIIK